MAAAAAAGPTAPQQGLVRQVAENVWQYSEASRLHQIALLAQEAHKMQTTAIRNWQLAIREMSLIFISSARGVSLLSNRIFVTFITCMATHATKFKLEAKRPPSSKAAPLSH
jgi:hypothetical protein